MSKSDKEFIKSKRLKYGRRVSKKGKGEQKRTTEDMNGIRFSEKKGEAN